MGDTMTTSQRAQAVEADVQGDLAVSSGGVSAWEARAIVAQDQLAAIAHDLGEISIDPSDITPENTFDIEQQIYRAALIRGIRGDDLSELIYQVQRYSQDVQSEDGYDPQAIRHAPMDVEQAGKLSSLQGTVVGARHGTALDVASMLEVWQGQIDRVTEIAQIYEHSGSGLQREAMRVEEQLAQELQGLNRPRLEVVKK
jgi:hypothetical protein